MAACLICSGHVETDNFLVIRGTVMPICLTHQEAYRERLMRYELQALADVVAEQTKKEKGEDS